MSMKVPLHAFCDLLFALRRKKPTQRMTRHFIDMRLREFGSDAKDRESISYRFQPRIGAGIGPRVSTRGHRCQTASEVPNERRSFLEKAAVFGSINAI